ncbi:hypothetical protein PIB30_078444 [Stylosanthes scabra]|uniref:Uncharacterized protein n=1 Tax=Stylosanthes scabra TaxID=79078 RepID=A0ABU6ZPF3_9FABA|nr:hypothetical protein [Stylosanthes scabra]
MNDGVERGLVKMSAICSNDRVVCEMHSGEVVAKDGRRGETWLLQFGEKVLNPLDFRECRC